MLRDTVFAAAAAVLLCLSFPVFAISVNREKTEVIPQTVTDTPTASEEEQKQPAREKKVQQEVSEVSTVAPVMGFDSVFHLPVLFDSGVDSLSLHDYLVGALVGEMPLTFELEALKAQAVACRTYALRQYAGRKHDPAAVCTASSCCECWVSAEKAKSEQRARAEQAVSETDGLVLTYDGSLIEATFFSCSGGRTERAADVWGNEIPYLTAVDSPGEETAPRYFGTVTVPVEEFRQKVLSEAAPADLSGSPATWFGAASHTEGGGVGTVSIGGCDFSGKQLRTLFGLNSTMFTVTADETAVSFQTQGFGHRVGLSQYGAQAMALSGSDYRAILEHYYSGTELTDCRTLYP